jgi:sugar phosphate isomerase/epimerase
MTVHVGVKSDPIENRYSFEWLFDLMAEQHVGRLQLGSSFPFFHADEAWFHGLRRKAERRGIRISSTYTSYREMTGFFTGDPHLEAASRLAWERLIRVAAWVGAASAGASCGSVPRDLPGEKEPGLARFFRHMKELVRTAKATGLAALCIEPMSSLFEPPSTPEEMDRVTGEMDAFHAADPAGTVPLRFCADISHGLADRDRRVIVDNWRLFEAGIPHTHEFHFKNTDDRFDRTFGFSAEERARGIVDLARLRALIDANAERFPVRELVGYLELPGPKTGRDYTDTLLGPALSESLAALQSVFGCTVMQHGGKR